MSTDPPSPDAQLRLAEQRTDLAERRTSLAEERTYSAWVRTGLAAVAAGFAIATLFDEIDPRWATGTLGALFILTGGSMFVLAFFGYRHTMRLANGPSAGRIPLWVLGVLSLILLVGSAIALVIVVLGGNAPA